MKLRYALLFFAAALIFDACDKDQQQGVLLDFTPRQLEIPAGLNPTRLHGFVIGPFSTEHDRFESLTGTVWEDWTRVEPAQASLQINEPGLDWGFALEVSVLAYTDDPATAKEIFYRDQIPRDVGGRLDLIPTDFDANAGLLEEDEINIIIELRRLLTSPPQNLPVVFRYNFEAFRE